MDSDELIEHAPAIESELANSTTELTLRVLTYRSHWTDKVEPSVTLDSTLSEDPREEVDDVLKALPSLAKLRRERELPNEICDWTEVV